MLFATALYTRKLGRVFSISLFTGLYHSKWDVVPEYIVRPSTLHSDTTFICQHPELLLTVHRAEAKSAKTLVSIKYKLLRQNLNLYVPTLDWILQCVAYKVYIAAG